MLTKFPGELRGRWLLNIAYMTLGEYPAGVPAKWVIDPARFASEYDLPRFPDVAANVGLNVDSLAGGVVMDDFDRDGYLDVMVSAWGFTAKDQLRVFRSNGDGTFTERTKQAGLEGLVSGLNLRQGDYNNDGLVDVLPPDTVLYAAAIGRLVAAIHQVADPEHDPGPVSAWYAEPVGAERWDAVVRKAPVLAALRDELVALDAWMQPHPRPRTCHRDLWADNVRATAEGGLCVLDWENSGPADPTYELAGVLFEFGRAKEAEQPQRKSVELKPEAPLLRINLGQTLIALDDKTKVEEGVRELRKALTQEDDNAVAWRLLAQAYESKA